MRGHSGMDWNIAEILCWLKGCDSQLKGSGIKPQGPGQIVGIFGYDTTSTCPLIKTKRDHVLNNSVFMTPLLDKTV